MPKKPRVLPPPRYQKPPTRHRFCSILRAVPKTRRWGNRWCRESCAPVERIRQLYVQGLSTRQVAKQVGYSYSYVAKLCAPVARSREEAAILRQLATSRHWRTCRQQARRVVERHLGRKLKREEHVHHKDGDYTNNALTNLEVLSARDHAHRHRPPNPVPRHLRPNRRAYMQNYFARTTVRVRCVVCGQTFDRGKYAKRRSCSKPCRYELVRQALAGTA